MANKKTNDEIRKITPVAKPEENIGIDTKNSLITNIIESAINSTLDSAKLEQFSTVTQNRENLYKLIDTMCQDSIVASILETYAEDVTETSDTGRIVWAESSDANVGKYVNYLLESLNVDKNVYGWASSLIKYGDTYLKLFRQSDYDEDDLFKEVNEKDKDNIKYLNEQFKNKDTATTNDNKDKLEESLNVYNYESEDHYVHYVEAVSNPGEMFELTKFGKTSGFIQAPLRIQTQMGQNNIYGYNSLNNMYSFKQQDVDVYPATSFVHMYLENNSSRTDETVNIFLNPETENSKGKEIEYKVKRGQSLFYNTFKIWREMSLLENSVLLNRVTKSSIVRMISVEVGDMSKEQIATHLNSIKQLIEQKSALETNTGLSEYTNPGPVENNIYVPTRQGIGNITTNQIGGDVDVKSLVDLDYFQNKFFGANRIPKQYFGVTDDAAGFNGGSSLSIISSRYGKTIKRIQNSICQGITDMINLFLIDKKLFNYVNNFTIRMTAPITQEEIDKRNALLNKIGVIRDIMSQLDTIETPIIKLKIVKSLLSTVVEDPEVIDLIQEEIDNMDEETTTETKDNKSNNNNVSTTSNKKLDVDFENDLFKDDEEDNNEETNYDNNDLDTEDDNISRDNEMMVDIDTGSSDNEEGGEESYLPSPGELGIDLTSPK